ncbi:MAG: radical SAM mobile pair protein A [Bacteroidales bacterium]|nr:radical SAM mobile pair protein A [Bacteroidales bacterium]
MVTCIKSIIKNVNLVVGCDIGCPYCYARNNCRRFHMTDDFSKPEFFPGKLHILDNPKPHVWFMTGLSDFTGWKSEWRDEIFSRMKANPQHRYVFLTKRPERIEFSTDMENVWIGVTVTHRNELHRIEDLRNHIKCGHYHVTFEPMFSPMPSDIDFTGIDWVVVGTETGKRKGKSDSKPEWVDNILSQTSDRGIPTFMKEDLLPIMGEERMIQQMPSSFLL